jgi:elongation factor G
MTAIATGDIRNISLAGHGGTGKTTLAEAMLFEAKATPKMGSVDDNTSIADYEPEEKERKISIDSAVLDCTWKNKHINIIDTPGYPDFIGEVVGAARAVETMFITIDAPSGIQLNTRRVWQLACDEKLAKAIIITKMDGEKIEFEALLAKIRETFPEAYPLYLPIGVGPEFSGVALTLSKSEDIPPGVLGGLESAREEIMEKVIEGDDQLLEKYLDGNAISDDELTRAFAQGFASGRVVPILCVSAKKSLGVAELLDTIAQFAPSPLEGRAVAGTKSDQDVAVRASDDGAFAAQVFKTIVDPFVGKMNFFRIFRGTLANDDTIYNARTEKQVRIGGLLRIRGKEQNAVSEATAGDIVAVTKLEDLEIGDTLSAPAEAGLSLSAIPFPNPMVSVAVSPKSRADEQRITSSLAKLADENRTFKVERNRQTKELIVSGMSALHLDIMFARLKRRFEVEVDTRIPRIPYLETVTTKAEGHYRHKKQTGGRGQYAEVFIRIEPVERGEGFEFVDEIVQGRIPNQFIPAVEKGIRETLDKGVLAGFPCVDTRVRLYDGSFHEVDSSEAAFKVAASKAFQEAFAKARPVILEPVALVDVMVPNEYMGDITGNLNSKRGRILGMESKGDYQVIRAQVPMAEIASYATELKSMTGGQATYTQKLSHYDVVPAHIAEQVIAKSKTQE